MIDALKKITSPSVANAIETFKIRPRHHGNVSSEIRCLFPELGPMVGYAVPCVIRAEHEPIKDHRASTYGWKSPANLPPISRTASSTSG